MRKFFGKIWRAMPVWGRRVVIRLTQPSFTVSAAAVVIDRDGRVLLLNHILRPASGWGVPGGFLNTDEQPVEAAKRELFEEAKVKIENLEFFRVQTVHRHVEFWFVGRADGEPQANSSEILEARWFRLEEIPTEMNRRERRFIEEALRIGEKQQN